MEVKNIIDIFFSSDVKLCNEILSDKSRISEESQKVFNAVDLNKDGLIDYPEFANLIKEIEKRSCKTQEAYDEFEKNYLTQDKIKQTFDTFDTNKDGRIHFNEFKEIFIDLVAANIMAQIDSNK